MKIFAFVAVAVIVGACIALIKILPRIEDLFTTDLKDDETY